MICGISALPSAGVGLAAQGGSVAVQYTFALTITAAAWAAASCSAASSRCASRPSLAVLVRSRSRIAASAAQMELLSGYYTHAGGYSFPQVRAMHTAANVSALVISG